MLQTNAEYNQVIITKWMISHSSLDIETGTLWPQQTILQKYLYGVTELHVFRRKYSSQFLSQLTLFWICCPKNNILFYRLAHLSYPAFLTTCIKNERKIHFFFLPNVMSLGQIGEEKDLHLIQNWRCLSATLVRLPQISLVKISHYSSCSLLLLWHFDLNKNNVSPSQLSLLGKFFFVPFWSVSQTFPK